jgi:hypothetical protein
LTLDSVKIWCEHLPAASTADEPHGRDARRAIPPSPAPSFVVSENIEVEPWRSRCGELNDMVGIGENDTEACHPLPLLCGGRRRDD